MRPERGRPEGGTSGRGRDRGKIQIDRTTVPLTDREALEAAAVEVIVWGDPHAVLDAYEDGLLDPELFRFRRVLIEVVVAMIEAGRPPWPPDVIHRELLARGVEDGPAKEMVLNVGGSELVDGRLDGLVYRLGKVHEAEEQRRARSLLAGLAAELELPGGAARLRRVLEEVAV